MSFFSKLKDKITDIFAKSNNVEEIEDILIEADFGIELASKIAVNLKKSKDIKVDFENIVRDILSPYVADISVNANNKPFVIMIVGVNGTGKSTTIAKLAHYLQCQGKSVDIVACDTFRAAAVEQIERWAHKLNCGLFRGLESHDPASVAYDAISNTTSDVLIIDTAGRMHNNINLMNELSKIKRVVQKYNDRCPHETIITIDATTGQNTVEQIKIFSEYCNLSGLILTKMDSNAKGGTILNIVSRYKLPIYGVGVGESYEDFERFSIEKFCSFV